MTRNRLSNSGPLLFFILFLLLLFIFAGCRESARGEAAALGREAGAGSTADTVPIESPEAAGVVASALAQTDSTTSYDPSYVKLDYPGGDVPIETGVCCDVVVRAMRAVGVDLQKKVHEDMSASFSAYPNPWGLRGTDPNIDHRRVPNLMKYFERQGKSLAISDDPASWKPGDIVAWRLGNGRLHIGVVANVTAEGERLQVVHNIGAGARLEDVLFSWTVIGHYRWFNR